MKQEFRLVDPVTFNALMTFLQTHPLPHYVTDSLIKGLALAPLREFEFREQPPPPKFPPVSQLAPEKLESTNGDENHINNNDTKGNRTKQH